MNDSLPQPPYPNQPPPSARGGSGNCFFKGCIVVIVVLMVLGLAIGGLGWYLYNSASAFFTHEPVAIHKVNASDEAYTAAETKVAEFNQAISSGKAAVLTLTPDDLNAIVSREPRLSDLRDRLYLSIVNNQLVADTSFPLNDDKAVSREQRMFFNARIVLDASYASGDFTFQLARLEALDSQKPPPLLVGLVRNYLAIVNQNFNRSFHEHPERNDDLRQITEQLRTIVLKDNTVVATSVDHPKPTATPTPAPEASPVAETPEPK